MIGVRTRKSVPGFARRGEVFEIKTLATHPMDNGFMYGRDGRLIPRHIIHRFEAIYNGEVVFHADWHEAISTNPFISFYAIAGESGQIEFRWYDDDGAIYTDSAEITVT
jgi:sulfur-oxidizing protein SoxZ